MGLVLGIISFIITVGWCLFISFANSMSDAPSVNGFVIWPWFVGGSALSTLLITSHFLKWINW